MTRRLTNEEYKGAAIPIMMRCKACGHEWAIRPNNVFSGQGCPVCNRKKAAAAMANTKRKTHEQFIREATEKNHAVKIVGHYYDARTQVEVECVKCGRRWMSFPGNVLAGRGCSECAFKSQRYTLEESMRRINERDPTIEIIGDYTTASDNATFRCKTCGNVWSTTVTSVINGTGCVKCAYKRLSESKFKTHEQYVSDVARMNPTVEIIGEYKGSSSKIDARCRICGHEWSTSAGHLLGYTKCPKCAGNMQHTHEEFVEIVGRKNPNIEVLGTYVNVKTHVLVRCKKCGREWSPVAESLLSGAGCSVCIGNHRRTNEQFIAELSEVNDSIESIEEYKGAKASISFKCKRCGTVWSTSPYNVLHGTGCPNCCTSRRSFFEHALLYALRDVLGDDNVLSRDRDAILYELDIYIPSMKLAFEPGSWYYHKNRDDDDFFKYLLCKIAGIKLVTIYSSYPDMSTHNSDFIATSSNLGVQDWNDVKKMIKFLMNREGIDSSNVDWDEVMERARNFTGKRTTEKFKAELSEINPTIEVIGEFCGTQQRVKVRCRTCGNEWSPLASSLLNGTSCNKCACKRTAAKQKTSQEEFVRRVSEANPDVRIIGKYDGWNSYVETECKLCGHVRSVRAYNLLKGSKCPICFNYRRRTHEETVERIGRANPNVTILGKCNRGKDKVLTRCDVCGHEWESTPEYLISGRGCPKCGMLKSAKARRKSHEDFIAQLSERNPNVRAVGTYKFARVKMEFECIKCGNHWYATPDNILRGRGCPKCKYELIGKIRRGQSTNPGTTQ